jgi:hypothetical protein
VQVGNENKPNMTRKEKIKAGNKQQNAAGGRATADCQELSSIKRAAAENNLLKRLEGTPSAQRPGKNLATPGKVVETEQQVVGKCNLGTSKTLPAQHAPAEKDVSK